MQKKKNVSIYDRLIRHVEMVHSQPFLHMLPVRKLCEPASRDSHGVLAWGFSMELPRPCDMFRSFCVINFNYSEPRSLCSFSSDLLGVSTTFSVSHHKQMKL